MAAVEYWVWLGLAFCCGSGRTDELLEQFPDPEEFYRSGAYRDGSRLSRAERGRLLAARLDDARRIVDDMARGGVAILTPDDPRYPDRLRNIAARPLTLYVDGDLGDVDNELEIAMVGTRQHSDYGYRAANLIASELAEAGAVVVSGMAIGIDTVCHSAAVRRGKKTIAVMGCGIDRTYPQQNRGLREQIVQNGAVVTEFAPGVAPLPQYFPIRNRIISGLSMGTVVVEASEHSGSLITGNLALEQGRDVFAVPGDIFSAGSRGTLLLLRQGAVPVGSARDVLEEYRFRFAHALRLKEPERPGGQPAEQLTLEPAAPPPAPEPKGLSGAALEVWRELSGQPQQLEELSGKLKKSAREVLTALTELEIMGLACALSGKRYRRG